ncbi:hypothetical protein JCM8202v2_006387 [Rhodotorula sphaerocarpa]
MSAGFGGRPLDFHEEPRRPSPVTDSSSTRNLIVSLARSLSRSREDSTERRCGSVTREAFIKADGGMPWGALGMGGASTSTSPSTSSTRATSRGRNRVAKVQPVEEEQQSHPASRPPSTKREWSVSRREWVEAGSARPAAAVGVLLGERTPSFARTGNSSEGSSPSSSRSASPKRGRAGTAVVATTAAEEAKERSQDGSRSRSQSRAGRIFERVRNGWRSPSRTGPGLELEEEVAEEAQASTA